MEKDILTRADIRINTLYERYSKIVEPKMALVMACAEGGRPELADPVLELEATNNRILMEETYKCLVPAGTPLPEDDVIEIEDDDGDTPAYETQIKKMDE